MRMLDEIMSRPWVHLFQQEQPFGFSIFYLKCLTTNTLLKKQTFENISQIENLSKTYQYEILAAYLS